MRWMLFCVLLWICGTESHGGHRDAKTDTQLKVLSNNVGIFPRHVVARYPAKLKEKKKHIMADEEQRATLLARSLIEFDRDPDVLLLQEIWSIKARDVLIKELAQKYPYSKHPAAYDKIFAHLAGARDSYKEGLGPLERTARYSKTPKKRIDYLFTFGDIAAESTIVDPAGKHVSDHLAVFGVIELK